MPEDNSFFLKYMYMYMYSVLIHKYTNTRTQEHHIPSPSLIVPSNDTGSQYPLRARAAEQDIEN